MPESILVVDDDTGLAEMLCLLLAQEKYRPTSVPSADKALAVMEKTEFDLVLTDVRMPGSIDGMGLLKAVKEKWPEIPVVVMTAHGTVAMAVEAMKVGAADFITKPFEREELKYVVDKALKSSAKARDEVPRHGTAQKGQVGLYGTTPAMVEVKSLIERVAPTDATVMLRGENGTGKEVAAREVHRLSKRAAGPFIPVNCGAIPDTLIESELFGYEKGAFTGANIAKPGRVELAEKGTLFLDEIGDMPQLMQVKVLRLLQDRQFERIGGKVRSADVRFIVATNKNLEEMVAAGTFREDLFHRINVVPIRLPPLRDRKGDIAPLARMFLGSFAQQIGRPDLALDDGAISRLEAHAWSGNVRQLQNLMERIAILAPEPRITAEVVDRELTRDRPAGAPPPGAPPGDSGSLDQRRLEAERAAITDALSKAGGNRTRAARLLGVSRRTLYNKLEALGLVDWRPPG